MIIKLNGYTFNDPSSGNDVYLDEPIQGLGVPPIRTSSGDNSGRNGGYVGSQFYGSRLITLTGWVYAPNGPAQMDTIRQELQSAVAQSVITVNITTDGGAAYLLSAYLSDLTMDIEGNSVLQHYKIDLIAPDPYIYDNSAGGVISVPITKIRPGGLTWPLHWPLTWSAGSTPTTVSNTGAVQVYPVITLTGSMTNPTITNATTGQFFALTGLTTTATDVVTIDMKNHAVLLNGGSISPYMTSTSTWWSLLTGDNDISLTTTGASDTVTGTITWRAAYLGI